MSNIAIVITAYNRANATLGHKISLAQKDGKNETEINNLIYLRTKKKRSVLPV